MMKNNLNSTDELKLFVKKEKLDDIVKQYILQNFNKIITILKNKFDILEICKSYNICNKIEGGKNGKQ